MSWQQLSSGTPRRSLQTKPFARRVCAMTNQQTSRRSNLLGFFWPGVSRRPHAALTARTGHTCSDVSRHLGTAAALWLLETLAEGLGLFLSKTLDSMDGYRLWVYPSQCTGHETNKHAGFVERLPRQVFTQQDQTSCKGCRIALPFPLSRHSEASFGFRQVRSHTQAVALNHQVCLLLLL